jgi:hypothetical protein
MNTTYNIQELKGPDLRIHGVDKGAKIQNKGIRNLVNEFIAKIFPNLSKDRDSHKQEAF